MARRTPERVRERTKVRDRTSDKDNAARGPKDQSRGLSSAGRAPALQAGGRRFDPDRLHHLKLCTIALNM